MPSYDFGLGLVVGALAVGLVIMAVIAFIHATGKEDNERDGYPDL